MDILALHKITAQILLLDRFPKQPRIHDQTGTIYLVHYQTGIRYNFQFAIRLVQYITSNSTLDCRIEYNHICKLDVKQLLRLLKGNKAPTSNQHCQQIPKAQFKLFGHTFRLVVLLLNLLYDGILVNYPALSPTINNPIIHRFNQKTPIQNRRTTQHQTRSLAYGYTPRGCRGDALLRECPIQEKKRHSKTNPTTSDEALALTPASFPSTCILYNTPRML